MTAAEYTFKKNDQVITLDTKSAVGLSADGITLQIDPQFFFQN